MGKRGHDIGVEIEEGEEKTKEDVGEREAAVSTGWIGLVRWEWKNGEE